MATLSISFVAEQLVKLRRIDAINGVRLVYLLVINNTLIKFYNFVVVNSFVFKKNGVRL